ncbi:MAG: cupredoxin domain-containing protein [Pseudonocardiales bacterium]
MNRLSALCLAAALVLVGGCSNRESAQARAPRDTGTAMTVVAADGVQEITVSGSEQLRFTPSRVRAHPGVLRIILVNTGTTPHDLEVLGPGAGQTTGLIPGGGQGRVTVTLTPGVHTFECTLHVRVHMTGTIVVA